MWDYNTYVTTKYLKCRDTAFLLYFNHDKKNKQNEFSAMATITQDMRYRLSLIKYAERFGALRLPSNIKPTVNTFTTGNAVMTTP